MAERGKAEGRSFLQSLPVALVPFETRQVGDRRDVRWRPEVADGG